jgi:hypothetical protein
MLLQRSNFLCNVCKGSKGYSFLIHHIKEYEKTQDNAYHNLIVLCPNDHDMVHRGLAMHLTPDDLMKCKDAWEKQVEIENAQRAAQSIDVNDKAIDYVNANRIEELCLSIFGEIPATSHTHRLKGLRILDASGSFDQKYVKSHLSGGRYLFDYINKGEALHYKELMEEIAQKVDFLDLSSTSSFAKLRGMEGKYAYFIGGVIGKHPELPITESTLPVVLRYRRRKVCLEWQLDPQFLLSMSAIGRIGIKQRYIIYCLVRSVSRSADGFINVSASPLFISWPNHYVQRCPVIAYVKAHERLAKEWGFDDEEE